MGAMQHALAIGLILLGIAARFAPHPDNVTPLAAIALFGGAYLPKRWAIWLPVAVIALSDVVIGLHAGVIFTWSAAALIGFVGWWVRRQPSPGRIVRAAILSSAVFFLVTNFGVWLLGENGTVYPKTLGGVWACFVAAMPFFRNTLAGDLVITTALFGLYGLIIRGAASRQPVESR